MMTVRPTGERLIALSTAASSVEDGARTFRLQLEKVQEADDEYTAVISRMKVQSRLAEILSHLGCQVSTSIDLDGFDYLDQQTRFAWARTPDCILCHIIGTPDANLQALWNTRLPSFDSLSAGQTFVMPTDDSMTCLFAQLLTNGASPDAEAPKYKDGPSISALSHCHVRGKPVMARLLLRAGASISTELAERMELLSSGEPTETRRLVEQALKPWSPTNHDLFPLEARRIAETLMLAVNRIVKRSPGFEALIDLWRSMILPQAILRN